MLWIRQNVEWASLLEGILACAPVVFLLQLCILLLLHSFLVRLEMSSHLFELLQPEIELLHVCRRPNLLVSRWTCSWLPELLLPWPKVKQRIRVELLLLPLLLALPWRPLMPPLLLLVLVLTPDFFSVLLVLDNICDG